MTQNEFTGIAAGKNIIMIQVESLQSFVLGERIERQEITPNLNRLMLKSHNFENHYFQTGAGATSDTDFTINTSYYPLKDSATFVRYGQNDFTSLAKELKDEGYSTYTYHGYNRAFWNRSQALDSLGYEKYFAKESYKNDEVINMGIPDEAFLSETVEYIKNQPKPALSYVITLSSHFPFHLPKELEGLNLVGSQYTDLSFGYLQNINYADRALGIFLEKLKQEGLYDNSLIVLFGDHYAKTDAVDMDGTLFDPGTLEGKEVPLFIKLPNQDSGVSHKNISSHIDVMPTVLNLVGAKLESFMFGTDLFSDKEPFFASVGYFGTDTIIGNGKIYEQKSGNNSATCSEWNGSTSLLLLSDCETLINKKTEEQGISDMIVRYNLFDKLQAR
jgi:phosphoglycerol transferase MdoB-like AlkP superfamily enzyme